ncbi:reverse transcriptase domain-containing protein [Tanacetum coccineum]
MVTSEGIRANPKKTKAIADMQSPKTLKEMQSLSGKLAALNRFLSRSAERSLPFFETLKNITKENKDECKWTEEAELAFHELKRLILELPILTTPEKKEALYVYLAASREAVRGVLVASRKGTQTPIWYVSRTLHEGERNYALLEKLALCLLHLSHRLRRYFEAHPIQGQVLADFINEVSVGTRQLEVCNVVGEGDPTVWTLYTDGASSQRGVGAGLVLIDPSGAEYTYATRLTFSSTNNEAEYEALLAGLRIARKMKADILSKLASVAFNHLTKEILVEVLNAKSVDVEEVSAIVEGERHNWMTPIIECLEKGIWPNDENKVGSLRIKISQYVMEDGVLFKKSYLSPLLRCVGPLQANYIIREVHEGACGMHAGARSMVAKIVRQGYYWPSMHGDTKEVIDKCDSCQIHAPVPKLPKTRLTSIMSPWPFYQWGLDILGPLPEGPEKLKFGLPRVIVTDNGTQLVNDPFKSWCEKWKIKQMNIAVAHPQANGLVERANKSLMHGLKARLRRERLGWVDELPNILWAHRTMMKTSNGETPFSLTYGSEAVISVEIGMPTYRTIHFNEAQNEEEMRLNLDLSQERRETAIIREARYKKKVEQYYNKRFRPMSFKVGAFVYRKNAASRVENPRKLGPNWEGPYRVTKAYSNGSYKLAIMHDREVPRTWHAINLRNCFM